MNKQKATQERKEKNQARADELAKDRQARADAKAAALAQAAIDRKEKQEGIAQRIEVSSEVLISQTRRSWLLRSRFGVELLPPETRHVPETGLHAKGRRSGENQRIFL